jgi:hypothetical protein
MGKYKLAVLGVSEARWNGNGRTEITNGNILVYLGMSNTDNDHIRGLGILINNNIRGALVEWNPVSERIIAARIQTKLRKTSIVQCYAPTENAELVEAFYSLLGKTLFSIKISDIVVMIGDLNAQIGNNNQDTEHIMGRHGIPCENENANGQLLIELCGKHGFLVDGMVFSHRDCHKITWVSPDKDNQMEN